MKGKRTVVLLFLLALLGLRFPAGGAAVTINLQMPSMDPSKGHSFYSEDSVATVADDFVSDGVAISGVTWWGSYWDDPNPEGISSGDPLADSPNTVSAFVINIWSDIPSGHGMSPWAHPGEKVHEEELWSSQNEWTEAVEGTIDRGSGKAQTVFKYEAAFTSELMLDVGETFWVSIRAIDGGGNPTTYWGWQESEDHWNANGVQQGFPRGGPSDWWYTAPGKDMAFSFNQMPVPLPASLLLLASGLAMACVLKRRKRAAS
jgi:hypothetical protein